MELLSLFLFSHNPSHRCHSYVGNLFFIRKAEFIGNQNSIYSSLLERLKLSGCIFNYLSHRCVFFIQRIPPAAPANATVQFLHEIIHLSTYSFSPLFHVHSQILHISFVITKWIQVIRWCCQFLRKISLISIFYHVL